MSHDRWLEKKKKRKKKVKERYILPDRQQNLVVLLCMHVYIKLLAIAQKSMAKADIRSANSGWWWNVNIFFNLSTHISLSNVLIWDSDFVLNESLYLSFQLM